VIIDTVIGKIEKLWSESNLNSEDVPKMESAYPVYTKRCNEILDMDSDTLTPEIMQEYQRLMLTMIRHYKAMKR
jgi:hypothetical protein